MMELTSLKPFSNKLAPTTSPATSPAASVGYLSALSVELRIGMGVAQFVTQLVSQRNVRYADEYNISTAHAHGDRALQHPMFESSLHL